MWAEGVVGSRQFAFIIEVSVYVPKKKKRNCEQTSLQNLWPVSAEMLIADCLSGPISMTNICCHTAYPVMSMLEE